MESINTPTKLNPFNSDIVTASGAPLNIKGRTQVTIEIEGIQTYIDVLVSEIDVDAILGLDFMKSTNAFTNIAENTLLLNGKMCHLNCTGQLGCYRIVVAERTVIPAYFRKIY